jgi:hypothetical protein
LTAVLGVVVSKRTGDKKMGNSEMLYKRKVWCSAVNDAELEVMRLTATIPGGKKIGESVEQYVERVRKMQDEVLANLRIARQNHQECGGK